MVSRKNPKSAGVDGHGFIQTIFHAEIGDAVVDGPFQIEGIDSRIADVVFESALGLLYSVHEGLVFKDFLCPFGG